MVKVISVSQARNNIYKIMDETAKTHKKSKELIELVKNDPFQKPPPYEKLVGN